MASSVNTSMSQQHSMQDSVEDSMFDSGFSGSLRLSATGSMSTSKYESDDDHAPSASLLCSRLGHLQLSDALPADCKEYFKPDEDGDTQLHLAVASGHAEVVRVLSRMAPHKDLLSLRNRAGYAPLHLAVMQNQPALVGWLVVAGASVEVHDAEGNSPLHLAARRGHVECARSMLQTIDLDKASGEVGSRSRAPSALDAYNAAGECCVHLAVMGGHVDFLRFLSWIGADLNVVEGRGGRSAMHLAVGAKNMPVIQFLLELGIVNANQLDWYGRTPFHMAACNGALDIAHLLASRVSGCDVSVLAEMQTGDVTDTSPNTNMLLSA